MNIIGRKEEIKELERLYSSKQSEFVAIYGRRRIGKTFLIKELFKDRFAFWHTGLSPYDREKKDLLHDQLQTFYYSLQDFGLEGEKTPTSWLEAFRLLEKLLKEKNNGEKQVVFIDEMPWMDTQRSRFIPALEHFWNGWAVKRDNVMLIVCGSSTSWIADNVIYNKGGLYNRLTCEIKLCPFTLSECDEFFKSKSISMSHYDLAQTYMVFGGVPQYLNMFTKGLSTPQNIDNILFNKQSKLKNEFDVLFKSLFTNADEHMKVVKTLAKHRYGLNRTDILKATDIKNGGNASRILKELTESDFIKIYIPFGEKNIKKYRLADPYCMFYTHFIDEKLDLDSHFYQKNNTSQKVSSWRGLAFEELCFNHIDKIKEKLSIAGVTSTTSPWIVKASDKSSGHQIDMLIKRSDNVVNLCEIKFYKKSYSIDKKYDDILRERIQTLEDLLPRRWSVHLTFIASFGLQQNEYSGQVQNVITLDDFFDK